MHAWGPGSNPHYHKNFKRLFETKALCGTFSSGTHLSSLSVLWKLSSNSCLVNHHGNDREKNSLTQITPVSQQFNKQHRSPIFACIFTSISVAHVRKWAGCITKLCSLVTDRTLWLQWLPESVVSVDIPMTKHVDSLLAESDWRQAMRSKPLKAGYVILRMHGCIHTYMCVCVLCVCAWVWKRERKSQLLDISIYYPRVI